MEKIAQLTGPIIPLRSSNTDTDQIIPAVFLKRVTKTGYDDALFHHWRQDPSFVLNQEPYRHGGILVTGADFGTGSSREHAVWALRDFGITAVLSPRFGEIFRGNAGKQGLLTGVIPEEAVERLWAAAEASPGMQTTVDLVARTVTIADETIDFEIDDYTRWRLLEGLDDIALTLRDEERITAFEASRPSWMPRTLPVQTGTQ
ncbi:3-isopropylmalate dehydratase small subunit [Agrococcus sp. SGAir0287]|uniref:3-isopropylmalate dehydratase small subunit n=1 Tax=Agrococcus sp. SGAir0287 TaxID=2070347 RepID=UPI0010CCE8A3|nr:3-isopropylmalate dehydratase small subunit [Agrococcus sp. SGAir0287]QCR18805.1 3-isopropylmalate dehydratase small subunit [Agrococcus sp. SGAir0287]